jgi:hypothetical protein
MISVFSKEWFKKYNRIITKVARLPLIGEWIFCIKKFGFDLDINNLLEIQPNACVEDMKLMWTKCVKVNGQWVAYDCTNKLHNRLIKKEYKEKLLPTRRTHFFVRNEFALRLQKVFYPIWIIFHTWDMLIANRFCPQLNLGFDTLTVYPDANAIDGYVKRSGSTEQLETIKAGDGTGNNYSATELFCELQNGYAGNNNNYTLLVRSILLFNTGSLGADATISGAVLSTYYKSKQNLGGVYIVSSTPASDTTLANSDYGNLGATSFGYLANASISASQYNDFTLNASGLSAISKTSLSKFGMKIDIDFTGTGDGATINGYDRYYNFYSSRTTGTGNDPKLVVTYTTSTAYTTEITEALAMVSSDTQAQALLSTIINNLSLSETQTDNSQFNQSATDNLVLSEQDTESINRGAIINDNLSLEESETNLSTFNQTMSESLANSEETVGSISFSSTIQETINGSESLGIITKFVNSISDSLAIVQELWGDWWTELSKHTTSWTQSSKNTTSYTQQSKNTTSWTQETKNKTNTKLG